MSRVLFVWPIDKDFQPEAAKEEAAKKLLQSAVGEKADVDCDSYPEVRRNDVANAPYEARFLIRICNADAELDEPTLITVGEQLGCPCRQGLVADDS